MKRIAGIVFHIALPLAVLASAGVTVYLLGRQAESQRRKPPPRVSVPVEVIRAQPHEGHLAVKVSGVAAPYREVELSAQISGRVISKSDALRPGRFVESGEELLTIDPSDYELGVALLEQELEKADAELQKMSVEKGNADLLIDLANETVALRKRELNRVKTLEGARATSAAESDSAESAFLTARQQLLIAENLVRQLEINTKAVQLTKELVSIQLKKAKLDLERTVIRAPCSGVVVATDVEQNAYLQPGERVAIIDDTSKVEVRCHLTAGDLDYVSLGKVDSSGTVAFDPAMAHQLPPLQAIVRFRRAGKTYQWQGVLSRQDGLGIDESTRTLPVRIEVADPLACHVTPNNNGERPLALVRGMFVEVELQCQAEVQLARLPESAVRPGKQVWVMRNDRLQMEPIGLAAIQDGHALVDFRGFNVSLGDSIISSPVPNAKEGLLVSLAGAGKGKRGGGPGGAGPPGGGRPGGAGPPGGKRPGGGPGGKRPGAGPKSENQIAGQTPRRDTAAEGKELVRTGAEERSTGEAKRGAKRGEVPRS